MALTVTELGVLCLVFFGVFHWLGIFIKFRSVLAMLGAVAVGGGFIGRLITIIGGQAQHLTGVLTGWVFGAALSAVLFLILVTVLIHDLHPRGGKPGRRTPWVALAVGVLLAAGVSQIPALAPVAGGLRGLLSGATGFVSTL